MEHADLVAEFPTIEKLTPAERIQLARERRTLQLLKCRERERTEKENLNKTERVRFKSGIALLEATSRNDIEEVKRLLEDENANPNSHNEDGLTPLHQCAIDNNEDILIILLDHGADVNSQDTELWTPLHAAACCAHIEVVKHLIERGANLLAVNADGNMPYDICDDDATLDVIESEMARRGITQENIDEERGSAERQMLADMKWLHQHGASLDYKDLDGATPLHVAACNGYYDVAAFLLRCSVSPNNPDDDSWLPMHAAACWAQPDLVELLAEYGADVNCKTESGETPLDLCEDDTTRHVILTLQAEAARRRRLAFPRDSRRQSKKRKSFSKFESPQSTTQTTDSPFSARGAIRRLSLRDRAGVTLARIEARQEAALLRSFSLEDTSAKAMKNDNTGKTGEQASTKNQQESGNVGATNVSVDPDDDSSPSNKKDKKKRSKRDKKGSKDKENAKEVKAISPDEWRKKVQGEGGEVEVDTNSATGSNAPEPPERNKPPRKKKDRRIEESPKSKLVDKSVTQNTSSSPSSGANYRSINSSDNTGNGSGGSGDKFVVGSGLSELKKNREKAFIMPGSHTEDTNGTVTLADISLQSGDGESKKHYKAPKDHVIGPSSGRNKRFACCSIS